VRAVYWRRRLVALALLGLLVFGVIRLASGGGGSDERGGVTRPSAPRGTASAIPLREQVGGVVLLSFNGTSAPAYVRRILRERRAAGVTLFAQNIADPGQVRALTAELRTASGGRALVAIDQEGGSAVRLPWAPAAGAPQLATPAAAGVASHGIARSLAAVGVDVNFAPVADVAGTGSAVAARAYPGGAAQVAAASAAAVRAYRGTGVAPTAKHFPGFGRATANTDDAPVSIDASRAELASDLAPFRAGIAAGVPLVMVSHALYPAYDARAIASQSRTIVSGLLRGELGFRGVVVTDSMEAQAVLARSTVAEAAVRAIDAGCDLVLLTGPGSYLPVYRRLLAEARSSPAFRQRIAQSAARVTALEHTLGAERHGR
jgi:beta-N-acetylhexosaminidase